MPVDYTSDKGARRPTSTNEVLSAQVKLRQEKPPRPWKPAPPAPSSPRADDRSGPSPSRQPVSTYRASVCPTMATTLLLAHEENPGHDKMTSRFRPTRFGSARLASSIRTRARRADVRKLVAPPLRHRPLDSGLV
jgi:hypothetical protein